VWPVRVEALFPVGPFFSFVFLGASQNTFQQRFGRALCRERFARRGALRPRGGRPSNRGDHHCRKHDPKHAQLHDILPVGHLRTSVVPLVI